MRTQITGVPFSSPPATINGGKVPQQDWDRFCYRAQAVTMLTGVNAAIATVPSAKVLDLAIVDNTAADGYALNQPLDPANPLPTDIADFWIYGHVSINGSNSQEIAEWAGELFKRQYVPDMGAGDRNYNEVGWGADAVDVAAPGKLACELLPGEGLIQLYWAKAS